MKHALLICPVMAATLVTGGCATGRYRSQPLGPVPYALAFREGCTVFSQYFSVASADQAKGRIEGRPKRVVPAPGRLLGNTPTRQIATMRIREKGPQVVAEVRVRVERQEIGAVRAMQPVTVDTELPTQSPVLESGALSPDQDQAWVTTGRNEALERAILRDLLDRIAACRPPPR